MPDASPPTVPQPSNADDPRRDLLPSVQAALGPAYTLERELGGGGMSRVFVATDNALARRVAVKVLSPELLQGVSAERFAREVALAAKLQDPHIVPVLTTGATSDGLPFYTMPFIEGESLRERMRRGSVPLDEALRILRDVAEALEYAHARGIVHRDIKPENVLLSGRSAVVADFGIAKALTAARTTGEHSASGTLTSIGMSLGTPGYMAPEQALGDATDHRADLYAWGMMAWELLAAAHPFAHRTTGPQLMAAQLSEMPKPLDEARPGLPPSLSALVMRCLAKAPAERPDDAAAVLAALGGATTDLAVTTGRRAPVTAQSRGRTVGIAAAVLVLLLGGGAWFMSRDGASAEGTGAAALAAAAESSVAVLPFEHQGDTADVYLTDGITDEIRNKLTGVSNLLVIARTSSNQYRGTNKTPQEIAEELGVRWLLTGTVRVVGTGAERRVLVRPELVEVTADGRLQSRGGEPFEGPMTDVLRAQGEVAGQVVRSMEVAVGGADRARMIAVPTRDAEAYDLYLRGMAAVDGGANANMTAIKQSLPYFEQAVARDSGLVEAWSAIAASYALSYANESPRSEYAQRARAALDQLERLAPGSADVLRTKSNILAAIDGDTEGSYRALQEARRLAPGDVRILRNLAGREADLGRFEEALRDADAAIRIDPRFPSGHSVRAQTLVRLRRFDEARAAAARARAIAPASITMVDLQIRTELAAGDLSGARRLLEEAIADIPRDRLLAYVSTYYFRWWMVEGDNAARLLQLPPGDFVIESGHHVARAQSLHQLGDRAAARAYADSAVRTFGDQLRTAPQDAQTHVLQGLMHAYVGRVTEALAAVERGLELARAEPGSSQTDYLAYYHYLAARTAALVGDKARAIEWVRACLAVRPMFTAAWLRLDPTFAPLLGDPAFEKVLAEAP